MAQSIANIYIHAVFHTKGDYTIPSDMHDGLYITLRRTLRKCGCVPLAINGTEKHVHILFDLSTTKSLAQVVRIVKMVGNKHIKERLPSDCPFAWQNGYYAQSVSYRILPKVKLYIENQKQHHRKVSVVEEMRLFRSE